MEWYYVRAGERVGPVSEGEFQERAAAGDIGDDTLVWREGFAEWTRYGGLAVESRTTLSACAECGQVYPIDEMVAHKGVHVCAVCKPLFFQKIQEGAALPGAFHFAGFWIRFLAYFIDACIMMVVSVPLSLTTNYLFTGGAEGANAARFALGAVLYLLSISVYVAYMTFFVGRFAATPGKMACGLKIIRADGSRVTYLRAFGRYLAEFLSSIVCMIGFLMAGFDEQKRALHDHICDTRVVYK